MPPHIHAPTARLCGSPVAFPRAPGVVTITKSAAAQRPLGFAQGLGARGFADEGRVITVEYEGFFVVTVYSPNSGGARTC